VVALDKLSAQKTTRVRELVEATGARLIHLPGYSPDFNPIEHAWSKLKALLRKVGARTLRKLQNALGGRCSKSPATTPTAGSHTAASAFHVT
jgi:transposase